MKMSQTIKTTTTTGQQVLVSLVQEKPYLFSNDYLVEIVGRGQSVLKAETLKILVGTKRNGKNKSRGKIRLKDKYCRCEHVESLHTINNKECSKCDCYKFDFNGWLSENNVMRRWIIMEDME